MPVPPTALAYAAPGARAVGFRCARACLLALLALACGAEPERGAPPARGFAEQVRAAISDCTCTHNAYNCPDFPTAAEAQACFQQCQEEAGGDVHRLDRDGDGRACEWNP